MTAHTGLASRSAARQILFAVLVKRTDFEQAFDQQARSLDGRDRAFVRHLALISLRRLGGLKTVLASLLEKPFDKGAESVECAMLLGLAQILLLETEAHAAVSLMVEDVKQMRGPQRHLFAVVNAVLRRAVRERDIWAAYLVDNPFEDLPPSVRDRWLAQYGPETLRGLALALRPIPDTDITLSTAERPERWAELFGGTVVGPNTVRRPAGDVAALPGFEEGHWWVQDLAASLPVQVMGDVAGKYVLDLCAAPGGKTLQLADRGADVVALDRSAKRLERLRNNLDRTGLTAHVVTADALTYDPDRQFDAVLLDAPCSATGTYRRNPDGLWLKGGEDIDRLAALQKKLLSHCAVLLKPGGMLLYCVCSMEATEGEDQWSAFMAETKDFVADPIKAEEIQGPEAGQLRDGTLRVHPALARPVDGFFIARARRL